MNCNFNGFEEFARCSSLRDSDEEEGNEGDGVDGVDGDDAITTEEDAVIRGFLETEYLPGPDGDFERLRVTILRYFMEESFINQRKILERLCGPGSGEDDGARDDNRDDAQRAAGRGREETQLDLFNVDVLYDVSRRRNGCFSKRLRLYDKSFGYDLTGSLRHRGIPGDLKTRPNCGDPREQATPAIRDVRIAGSFFHLIKNELLREMLIKSIANLPDMESLKIDGDVEVVVHGTLMPLLEAMGRPWGDERGCHLKELSLEIHDKAAEHLCVDPIIRAVGGGEGEGQGSEDTRLPLLEKFRLVCCHQEYNGYHLKDDGAFVRLLNKRSIKHLVFTGFLKPRDCQLMQHHLSRNPGLETLEISLSNFFENGRSESLSQEDSVALDGAMRCLVQLTRANPNVKEIRVVFPDRMKTEVQRGMHEINVRTALNRNGLKHFYVGCCDRPSPTSCVDFLARLGTSDRRIDGGGGAGDRGRRPELTDIMALEALYLSMQMRPDLCHQ